MAAKLMTSRFPGGAIPNNINIILLGYPSQSIKLFISSKKYDKHRKL